LATTPRPLLCATVTASTTAELRTERDRARGDMVELRLDTLRDPDVAGALAGRRLPVIVTCRAVWEGGQFSGSEEERHRLLGQALDLGAEYVDIEWRAGFDDLLGRTRGQRVVLSSHDFLGMPGDLKDRVRAMRATGAEVVKIAAKASRLSDCLPLLDVACDGRSVVIAMGDAGVSTRILAGRFRSAWTYAGALSDVGQVSAASLIDDFRFYTLSDSTELYGLVGSPIAHSVSPAMHNAAFAASGRDAVYLPLPATDAQDFVAFANALGVRGASVTIPFKLSLAACADELDEAARRIGAVNTLRKTNGAWHGKNTDDAGFLRPLDDRRIELRGRRASILGSGGSARAVAVALASRGAVLTVHARDRQRAACVVEGVRAADGAHVGEWPPAPGSWDLLVNCTPVGMHPRVDDTPLDASKLSGDLVYDLVYNPLETRLLREAAAAGCRTISGLDMLVAQAVEQFTWWTGERPDASVMRAAALTRLSEFNER
jgi:3-dehydroquinate dehydratase/shikimate dehydrogenase